MDTHLLYLILAGIIGLIIGYFIGRTYKKGDSTDITELKHQNERLEMSLEVCRNKLSAKGPSAASTSASISNSFATNNKKADSSGGSVGGGGLSDASSFDPDAVKTVFGKRIKENDLTLVEGIGPKIQELFHQHEVKTWHGLAKCSIEDCQKVLDSGGERFKIHNPGTWPKQASMAAEGKWQELLDWQDALDGGK